MEKEVNTTSSPTITEEELIELNKALEDQNKDNPLINRAREIGEPIKDPENTDEVPYDIENAYQQGQAIDLFDASMQAMDTEEQYRDEIVKEVSEKFDISVSEVLVILNVAKRHKAGEKFSVFNALPEKIRDMISAQILSTGNIANNRAKALFTELFIDEFNSEFVDKYLDRGIVEFNKSIQETLGSITNVVDIYSGHIRYMMEVELRKKAESCGNEAAKLIYNSCADAFTMSYTYSRMLTTLEIRSKVRRKLYKDNFQYARLCREFNYRNKDSKFSIRNIEQLTTNLMQHLSDEIDITEDDAKAFTILFIRSCDDLDLNKLPNAMYVYYTIFNIVNLGFDTNKSSFYHTVVNYIKKVLNIMHELAGKEGRFETDSKYEGNSWLEDDIPSDEEIDAFMNSEKSNDVGGNE